MRFQTVAAGETWAVLGRFPSGRTVSCTVWDGLTGGAISQATTTTSEISTTGIYRYLSSQLTAAPTAFTIIVWQMTDSLGGTDEGVIAVGGYPDNVNATISSRATPAQVATELGTYDGPTHAELIAEINAVQADIAALPAAPSAGAIADAIWDEDLTGHTIANSASRTLTNALFEEAVWVSLDAGTAGTGLFIGTPANPVSNMADAITIAQARGLRTFRFVDSEATLLSLTSSQVTSLNTMSASFITSNSVPVEGNVTGAPHTLTGLSFQGPFVIQNARFAYSSCSFVDCRGIDFAPTGSFFANTFLRCNLFGTYSGTSLLTGGNAFIDCRPAADGTSFVYDGDPSSPLGVDMFYRWAGPMQINNLNAATGTRLIVDLLGGSVTINTANGNTQPARATIRGFGNLLGTAAGGVVDERFVPPTAAAVADAVWDELRAGHSTPNTYGQFTGDAAMRGTDGANTVVPLAAATNQAEHDATQAAIVALDSVVDAGFAAVLAAIAALSIPAASAVATEVWNSLRSSHSTTATMGRAMTLLLNSMVSRGLINIGTTPWQEVRYVFDEAAASDTVAFEIYELYDQAGVAISGNSASGNNPLADPTRIIAERRRV